MVISSVVISNGWSDFRPTQVECKEMQKKLKLFVFMHIQFSNIFPCIFFIATKQQFLTLDHFIVIRYLKEVCSKHEIQDQIMCLTLFLASFKCFNQFLLIF